MEPFVTHTGRALPLRRTNVDTDQIIPAVYLKRVTRHGFGEGLFAAWREDPSFVLNQPRYQGTTILVAGRDFGTGSSREHAVWALASDWSANVYASPGRWVTRKWSYGRKANSQRPGISTRKRASGWCSKRGTRAGGATIWYRKSGKSNCESQLRAPSSAANSWR